MVRDYSADELKALVLSAKRDKDARQVVEMFGALVDERDLLLQEVLTVGALYKQNVDAVLTSHQQLFRELVDEEYPDGAGGFRQEMRRVLLDTHARACARYMFLIDEAEKGVVSDD